MAALHKGLKLKIVVIDDEEGMRGLIRAVLEDQGHEIIEAEDGASGLETIRATIPDLIICDINMPEMSGDELFDTLKKSDPDLGVIPFVFLSGNVSQPEQISRLNKGADNCFKKPIDMKLLAAHVNSLLLKTLRVSEYIKRKLDDIAESLPSTIEHEFDDYNSLLINTQGYVGAIVSAMHDYAGDAESPCMVESIVNSELNYIRYCLNCFEVRRKLVRAANGEDLSWTLIFMVMQAQLENLKVYVSDLYVSIPSAKSTINARISSLIGDDVLLKNGDSTDGRRQQIQLTDRFRIKLMKHIDTSINMVKEVV